MVLPIIIIVVLQVACELPSTTLKMELAALASDQAAAKTATAATALSA